MPATPWTNHELIKVIAPFLQRGRQFDNVATRREERRAVFKPVLHRTEEGFSIREVIWLENAWPGSFRLVRDIFLPNGLKSSLSASGPDPVKLLANVEAIPMDYGFEFGHGFTLAKSHAIEPFGWEPVSPDDRPILSFESACASVAGLTVTLTMPSKSGTSADVALSSQPDDTLQLPQDFLAVLGFAWGDLQRSKAGWTARLGLRGREPFRSLAAEQQIEAALEHLSQTLAAPPQHFHDRMARSRWSVELRRGLPLLYLIAFAVSLVWLAFAPSSPVAASIAVSPLVAFILLGNRVFDFPRLHVPRPPRPVAAPVWRSSTARTRPPPGS